MTSPSLNMVGYPDRERFILSLWERGFGSPGLQRSQALLADTGAPAKLGERNRALLKIRNNLFGRHWALRSDCPSCAMPCSFAIDSVDLAERLEGEALARSTSTYELNGCPVEVRAPIADDLRFIGGLGDAHLAERALLARCLPADIDLSELGQDEIDELEELIERLDPAAVVSFALACPECGHGWTSALDIADILWSELQRAAELSLTDVDLLARAYGWTEDQVLALSPIRRAAYLQLVAAS